MKYQVVDWDLSRSSNDLLLQTVKVEDLAVSMIQVKSLALDDSVVVATADTITLRT